jgi:hypothetical protein
MFQGQSHHQMLLLATSLDLDLLPKQLDLKPLGKLNALL